jgi:multiple sugar transport system permease protein
MTVIETTAPMDRPAKPEQQLRAARTTRMPSRKRLTLAILGYLVAAVFILPYAEMIISALRPTNEVLGRDYLPHHFAWSNFTSLWSTGFGGSLAASLEIAGGSTLLVLLVALPAGYYTARHRFRGRALFLLLVLATQMFQPAAMLVGIQREFTSFALPSPILSLILVNAGFNMAFAIWILNAYFSSIPVELEQAAMVDGTSQIGAVTRITLPLAAPGIITAVIFTFISAWNELLVALTLSGGGSATNVPLTVSINNYIGQYSVDWGHLFAGSVIATIPVIILFAFIEGKVVGGLTAGSIK